MTGAKDMVLRPITAQEANALVKRVHYSGKVATNSQIHIGAFLNGKLEGALQFGPSLDKSKIQGIVSGTGWNEFVELNRMAFTDALPRNSESRALSIAMKLLRKHAPHVQWVVSFADATQCGDGTIYRASGFVLTDVRPNMNMWQLPDQAKGLSDRDTAIVNEWARRSNHQAHKMSLEGGVRPNELLRQVKAIMRNHTNGGTSAQKFFNIIGAQRLPGFQLRYLYFIDSTCRERLTVPILPFSEITRRGAGMYRGQSRPEGVDSDTSTFHVEEGSANLTSGLQGDTDRTLEAAR